METFDFSRRCFVQRNDDNSVEREDDQVQEELDDFEDYEDATEDDVDFAVTVYREEGSPVVQELPLEVVNDLDELIEQLRRYPGDAGTLGIVAIAGEFFVLVRVRGRTVQLLLNDGMAADEWPLARDVMDFFGEEEGADEPLGDLDMLADLGCPELELEALASDYDTSADELALAVLDKIKMGAAVRKVIG